MVSAAPGAGSDARELGDVGHEPLRAHDVRERGAGGAADLLGGTEHRKRLHLRGVRKVVERIRCRKTDRHEARAEDELAGAPGRPSCALLSARDQWDTNTRPIALDKVYYDDFCSLSKWARGAGLTTEPIDFTKLTWPRTAIDPKLAETPLPPC